MRILLAGLLAGGVTRPARGQVRDPYVEPRQTMVAEMIAAEGVKNERVLDSMRATPRHLFVKSTLKHLPIPTRPSTSGSSRPFHRHSSWPI